MPVPSPFHPRTSRLCTSYLWKEWAGYHAVRSFDLAFEREYNAFRQSTGMLDVTPLFKFDIHGPDAAAFISFVTVKDVSRLKDGQATYLCWCDEEGKVLDDGTVTRWSDDHFRMTSADPSLAWLHRHARGFDVRIEDVSSRIGALALQGPTSRDVLAAAGAKIQDLRFFRAVATQIGDVAVEVTRTGYTGDLGYEVWVRKEHALEVWDALMEAGAPFGIRPAGLDALDVTRIEAGFILAGVDYTSARRAMIASQLSSPYEIGLGWTVQLERERFLGQAALRREKREGSPRVLVGLDIAWDELEALFDQVGLPPEIPTHAWRDSIPVYEGVVQVGYATSGSWSPTLKQNLALATVDSAHGKLGTRLNIEWTVEHHRKAVPATVVEKPFFNPERKRSTPS